MRYFIRLSYNGKNYNGWQIQDNAPSVQQKLNECLSLLLKENVNTTGAGRTDTGVSAEEFYAHFDTSKLDNFSKVSNFGKVKLNFVDRLNGILPDDIAVQDIFEVNDDVHARFSAISRTYKYYITREKDVFQREQLYYIHADLDIQKMNKGAKMLQNCRDFSSFAKLHTDVKTHNCIITHAEWAETNGLLVFTITADRFLRNMVRAIVGTLLDLGRDKISLEDLQNIIDSKNRSEAGFSVPAHGLRLSKIVYPDNIRKQDNLIRDLAAINHS